MRLLLDEDLPLRLKNYIHDHEVKTIRDMGWLGKKNGELLALILEQFDVFLTGDRSVQYQQNLEESKIIFVVLIAYNNALESLISPLENALSMLNDLKPGTVTEVRAKEL